MKNEISITLEEFLTKCEMSQDEFEEIKARFIELDAKQKLTYFDSTREYSGKIKATAKNGLYTEEVSYRIVNTQKSGTDENELQIRAYLIKMNDSSASCELIYKYQKACKAELDSIQNVKCKVYITKNKRMINCNLENYSINEAINGTRSFLMLLTQDSDDELFEFTQIAHESRTYRKYDIEKKITRTESGREITLDIEKQLDEIIEKMLPTGDWKISNSISTEYDRFPYRLRRLTWGSCEIINFSVEVLECIDGKYTFDIQLYSYHKNLYYRRNEEGRKVYRPIKVNYILEKTHNKYYLTMCGEKRDRCYATFEMQETCLYKIMGIVFENYKKIFSGKVDYTFQELKKFYKAYTETLDELKY